MGVLSECEPIRQKSKGKGEGKKDRTARKSFVVPSHHHSLQSVVRDKNTEIAGEKKGEKLALCGRI